MPRKKSRASNKATVPARDGLSLATETLVLTV